MHESRNCLKYFPLDADPARPKWWSASYKLGDDQVVVPGVATNECPVSAITPRSRTLVNIVSKAKLLGDLHVLGNGSELPAKFIDGIEVIEMERLKSENVMKDYVAGRRGNLIMAE